MLAIISAILNTVWISTHVSMWQKIFELFKMQLPPIKFLWQVENTILFVALSNYDRILSLLQAMHINSIVIIKLCLSWLMKCLAKYVVNVVEIYSLNHFA